MAADNRVFKVEELDSPIQHVVSRRKRFFLTLQLAVIFAGLMVSWEILRQNLPEQLLETWPWRLKLLDLESGATVLTVSLVILFTRAQYGETIRPVIGWTFGLPPVSAELPVPISRDRSELLAVNIFNSGGGRAVLVSAEYRFALEKEESPSAWIKHAEFLSELRRCGLKGGKDFHFSFMRAGMPLMPGQSEMDKGAFVVLTSRATMRRFRILDIRLRFQDSLGDIHERVLPCRYVINSEL